MEARIWFITGISSGLGEALAQKVVEKGDFVIGTFRRQSQTDTFNETYNERGLALTMDVTDPEAVDNAFEIIQQRYKQIDVLVNNAGFGMAGAVEETSMEEVRRVFEANFFGALWITQKALPILRARKKGHILQISSHGGFKGFAGFGIYNASKFALEGFSEALAAEVAPLGIRLTLVEPGPFRTRFAGDAFSLAGSHISDYDQTAGVFRDKIKAVDGKQEGDPVKAAAIIFEVVEMENPPLRLPLGKTAVATLTSKLESVQHDIESFRKTAEAAVF